MGQLIKLQDYISRYEQDVYAYPARFVRLKKQQWVRTKENWEDGSMDASNLSFHQPSLDKKEDKEKQPFLSKMKSFLKIDSTEENVWDAVPVEKESESDDSGLDFTTAFHIKPRTLDDLKQQFLDQLFRFQLKWASSTLFEKSELHSRYFFEEKLKFFLQRFPDTFLTLYKPVFLLQKAPVEAEVILLTPTEALCISFLEEEDSSVFIGSNEHFWTKRRNAYENKVLNPLLSLNRTEKIVRKIFQMNEIELPVHKLVMSRNGYIDYPSAPYDVKLVEKRNFEEWFRTMRALKSPLKHVQLKGAHALLQFCQTSSMRRLEWEQPEMENES